MKTKIIGKAHFRFRAKSHNYEQIYSKVISKYIFTLLINISKLSWFEFFKCILSERGLSAFLKVFK